MKKIINNKKVKLILLIIWMIIVFYFSNQPSYKSTQTSDKAILVIEKVCNIDFSKTKLANNIVFIVRKSAHFLIYLLGGILSYNYIEEKIKNKKLIFLVSAIICILYSITDEIHQLFIIGRSCEIRDILIDSLGAILGIALIKIIKKIIIKRS